MVLSEAGLKLIESFERLRLSIYHHQAGVATIGYGHRVMDHDAFPEVMTEVRLKFYSRLMCNGLRRWLTPWSTRL